MADYQSVQPYTINHSKSGFANGTTTTISTGGTIVYSIRGKQYQKTQITNGATPTTDWATGNAFLGVKANKGSVFIVGFDSSGNIKCVQGTITDLDSDGNFKQAPDFGGIPLNFCPIGALIIKAGSTADATTGWLFGSSNMSAVTGITYTFFDLAGLPDRPQITS